MNKSKIDINELYTGIVYDALRQMGVPEDEMLLCHSLRPLDPDSVCYGPAFTNIGRVVSPDEDYGKLDAIRLEMYRLIRPNDVVVLKAGDKVVAHAGDITSLIYQKLGASGFVTDGLIRDGRRIRELGFPCFCEGSNPIDALGYWAITEYQVPIPMPGLRKDVVVYPGDYIYADSDGVMRIPKERHEEFEDVLLANYKREEACRQRFLEVTKPSEVFDAVTDVFEEHGRW